MGSAQPQQQPQQQQLQFGVDRHVSGRKRFFTELKEAGEAAGQLRHAQAQRTSSSPLSASTLSSPASASASASRAVRGLRQGVTRRLDGLGLLEPELEGVVGDKLMVRLVELLQGDL
ncbi:hypothetical protein ANO14919_041410 [Xylariales sp. No.14919]|nr:hypothetical protein ANO14919_041410 [Xylariales sp. No.14919]